MITRTLLLCIRHITVECNRTEICAIRGTHNVVTRHSQFRYREPDYRDTRKLRSDNVSPGGAIVARAATCRENGNRC